MAARKTAEIGNGHFQQKNRKGKSDKNTAIPNAEIRKRNNEENNISHPR